MSGSAVLGVLGVAFGVLAILVAFFRKEIAGLLVGSQHPSPPWWFTKYKHRSAAKRKAAIDRLERDRAAWREGIHLGTWLTYSVNESEDPHTTVYLGPVTDLAGDTAHVEFHQVIPPNSYQERDIGDIEYRTVSISDVLQDHQRLRGYRRPSDGAHIRGAGWSIWGQPPFPGQQELDKMRPDS